jgi:hypothetical protein
VLDAGLLIVRMVFGLLMTMHGSQKLFGWFGSPGTSGTAAFLEGLGFRPGRSFAAANGVDAASERHRARCGRCRSVCAFGNAPRLSPAWPSGRFRRSQPVAPIPRSTRLTAAIGGQGDSHAKCESGSSPTESRPL